MHEPTAKCPVCGGALKRIRRRPVDRLVSLFRPVMRYRCTAPRCDWMGNLPKPRPTGKPE